MNRNTGKALIGHIFNWEAAHLNQSISRYIDVGDSSAEYFLRDIGGNRITSASKALEANGQWMKQRLNVRFAGLLERPLLLKINFLPGRLKALIKLMFTDFSISSWWRLIRGPQCVVIHGCMLGFSTILLLRCLNKRLVYIHWGGSAPVGGRYLSTLGRWSLRMLHKIFVLMSPEIRYFTNHVKGNKIDLLPYPIGSPVSEVTQVYDSNRPGKILLLGNSVWAIDEYRFVLDRIPAGNWSKIICMLNYGREEDRVTTDDFVEKYVKKFGDSFFAWRQTVGLEEYERIIKEAPFYVCPRMSQSGLGMIYYAISQGKAIILTGDNYLWVKDFMGLDVYDLHSIKDFSYESLKNFIPDPSEYKKRIAKAQSFWKKYHSPERWRERIAESFACD